MLKVCWRNWYFFYFIKKKESERKIRDLEEELKKARKNIDTLQSDCSTLRAESRAKDVEISELKKKIEKLER